MGLLESQSSRFCVYVDHFSVHNIDISINGIEGTVFEIVRFSDFGSVTAHNHCTYEPNPASAVHKRSLRN
jgi:hypothetical protein